MENIKATRAKRLVAKKEDDYNPEGYADFLPNQYYHHSDKGCEVVMDIEYTGRPGEAKVPSVIKRCLTHGVTCHKEGWQVGRLLGFDNSIKYCDDCGEVLDESIKKQKYCNNCLAKRKKESRKKYFKISQIKKDEEREKSLQEYRKSAEYYTR